MQALCANKQTADGQLKIGAIKYWQAIELSPKNRIK